MRVLEKLAKKLGGLPSFRRIVRTLPPAPQIIRSNRSVSARATAAALASRSRPKAAAKIARAKHTHPRAATAAAATAISKATILS